MVGKGASRISTAAIWLLSLLGVWEYVKEVVSGLAAQGDAASRRVAMAELEAPPPWDRTRLEAASPWCAADVPREMV